MVLHDTKGGSGHTFSTLPPVVIGLRKKDTKNNDKITEMLLGFQFRVGKQ